MIWRSLRTGLEYESLDNGQVRVIDAARGREAIFNADGTPHSGEISHCGTDQYHMIQWAVGFSKVRRDLEAMGAAAAAPDQSASS
ncbi:MAG: hypothetical protein ACYDHH_30620 [Solirubrobacteraceae bacterium]